jgi:hypothetical protein
MDPYLEQEESWHDFHQSFIPTAREILSPQVRPNYVVKVKEHVHIHELPGDERRFVGRPDISIARTEPPSTAPRAGAGTLAAPAYARFSAAVDYERSSFLEIRDRQSRSLVLELLSPANKKPGSDREQYLAKRCQYLTTGDVHLVEIDLLRGSLRLPLEDLPKCDYYALVARVEERPRVGVWPIGLRDRLPVIPVPLARLIPTPGLTSRRC